MRPQQQNRRMRGRNGGGGNNNNNNNNNNRRGPNPLNRNYESNGPDVKIRGSAQQIAEKYATLARDAQSSGDRVMAENYLQHAEHYNRIIAAAQAQMPIQHVQQNRDEFDDDMDEERDEFDAAGNTAEAPSTQGNHGAGPQPVIEGVPAEVALNGENNGRGEGNGRENGGRENGGRHHRDRRSNYGQNAQRNDNGQQAERREVAQDETAPETAAAPVADLGPAGLAAQVEQAESASSEEAAPRKPRRPRRSRTTEGAAADRPVSAEAGDAPASVEG